ncbi:MAG: TetR/AcrR family transcriptional regulator [Jiangellaceae bacterium]
MPRVSEAHRERRRRQILDAARRCFIRKGFHQTSMADVLAEAGMSAGAVYRYYRGKNEIITAITGEVFDQVHAVLGSITAQDPPAPLPEAIRAGLRQVESFAFGPDGMAQLAPHVWAEATHDPALATFVRDRYLDVRVLLAELARAEQRAGRLRPDGDPDEIAAVLLGSVLGYLLQRLLIGDVTPDSYSAGLAAITT